jgi:hypothetical protein
MKYISILILMLVVCVLPFNVHAQDARVRNSFCVDQITVYDREFVLTRVESRDYQGVELLTCIYSDGELEREVPVNPVLALHSLLGHLRSCDSYVVMPSLEFEFLSGCLSGGELTAVLAVQAPEKVITSFNWQAYDGSYEVEGGGIFSYPLGGSDWGSWDVEPIQRRECPEYLALSPEDEFIARLFEATAFPGVCRYLTHETREIWLVGNMFEANSLVDERAEVCVNADIQTIAIASTRTIYPYQCMWEDYSGMPFILDID